MDIWKFYDFVDTRGVNLIREWLDGLPDKASAKIDTRIIYMQAISVWPPQYVSALKTWPDLIELRVASTGNQYRPIGFCGPGPREFTLVLGTMEKGKLPRRVIQTADANRRIVISDRSRIVAHVFAKRSAPHEPQE